MPKIRSKSQKLRKILRFEKFDNLRFCLTIYPYVLNINFMGMFDSLIIIIKLYASLVMGGPKNEDMRT